MDDQEFEDKYRAKENRSYLKYKKVVKISIYGAFSSGRINKLIKLRDYLRKYGYNARLSIDFESVCPRHENESIEEYNRRLSEKLNDWATFISLSFSTNTSTSQTLINLLLWS